MEDACWVGLLSTQELRKGERLFHIVSFSQCFLQQVPLPGSALSRHRSHWDIFPHFQDYGHFYLDLCVLPPRTKKHLGTGLVGLEEIHICPVQAIGIQSFTLSNATKREKGAGSLLAFQHLQERNRAFDWCLKREGINRFLLV